jgi:hypothetical protein
MAFSGGPRENRGCSSWARSLPAPGEADMDQPLISTSTGPTGFEPYTAFPGVEQALERQLGPDSKFQMSELQRRNFVRYLPWFALLMLPFQLGGLLLLFGITALAKIFGSASFLPSLISAGAFVLDFIALPGLFSGSRKGWAFFTYALLLSALGDALSLSLFGLICSGLLLWVTFQVKYQYK